MYEDPSLWGAPPLTASQYEALLIVAGVSWAVVMLLWLVFYIVSKLMERRK